MSSSYKHLEPSSSLSSKSINSKLNENENGIDLTMDNSDKIEMVPNSNKTLKMDQNLSYIESNTEKYRTHNKESNPKKDILNEQLIFRISDKQIEKEIEFQDPKAESETTSQKSSLSQNSSDNLKKKKTRKASNPLSSNVEKLVIKNKDSEASMNNNRPSLDDYQGNDLENGGCISNKKPVIETTQKDIKGFIMIEEKNVYEGDFLSEKEADVIKDFI